MGGGGLKKKRNAARAWSSFFLSSESPPPLPLHRDTMLGSCIPHFLQEIRWRLVRSARITSAEPIPYHRATGQHESVDGDVESRIRRDLRTGVSIWTHDILLKIAIGNAYISASRVDIYPYRRSILGYY